MRSPSVFRWLRLVVAGLSLACSPVPSLAGEATPAWLTGSEANLRRCEPARPESAQVEILLDPGATPDSGEMSGWMRWGDRQTFALVATAANRYRILAADPVGTLEVGELRVEERSIAGRFAIGVGACREGEFELTMQAEPQRQLTERRDRLARLFALERVMAEIAEAPPRRYSELPESLKALVLQLKDLLGADHPQSLLGQATIAEALLLARRASEALSVVQDIERSQERLLSPQETHRLRLAKLHMMVLGDLGRSAEALTIADQLLKAAPSRFGTEHVERWRITAAVAQLHLQIRAYGRAVELAEEADKGLTKLLGADHPDTMRNRGTIGAVRYVQHRSREGLEILEPMLASANRHFGEEARISLRVADLVARCYFKLGRWREGLPIAQRVHAVAMRELPAGDSIRQYGTLLLAHWYHELGRYAEAESLLRDALGAALGHLGESHPAVAETRGQLAMLLLARDRAAAAYAQADLAFQHTRGEAGEANHRTIWLRGIRALALDRLGRPAEALEEAHATAAGYQMLYGEEALHAAYSMLVAGRSESLLGRHQEAMATLREALRRQRQARPYDHPGRIEALGELGLAYRRGGQLGEAIATWEALVQEAERLREGVGPIAEYRQGFLRHWSVHYRRLVEAHITQGEFGRAFALTEMIKGRNLMEMLSTRLADGAGLLDSDESARLADLVGELSRRDQLLAGLLSPGPERAEALRARTEAGEALRAYRETLAARYPKYGTLMNIRLRSAADAPSIVPGDTALVSYVALENGLLAFVYTRELGLQARMLPLRGNLTELVRAYRTLLAPPNLDVRELVWRLADGKIRLGYVRPETGAQELRAVGPVARELRRLLLDPLAPALRSKRRWILSLDDALALLPFEALPWGDGRVIDSQEVSYIQSLSVLGLLHERPYVGTAPSSILAMGNPDYEALPVPSIPADGLDRGGSASGLGSAHVMPQRHWSSLPGAAKEVAQATAWFAPSRREVYLGTEASESTLQDLDRRRELARHRYLLFATHAWLNTDVPQLSSIVLAQGPRSAQADGYVTAAEWVGYQLDSELIVLSGCETALGASVRGEGVTGLPFALLVAGNRNAVLSLWKIDDLAAARLIPKLFRHLQQGYRPARALALAKRALARDSRYAAAHYWAAFVLYGG